MAGPGSLDDIHINVLAQEEVSHTLSHKPVSDASLPVPCESQILEDVAATAITTAAAASESPTHSLPECETEPPALTPVSKDSRQCARQWKQREGKEKYRDHGAKFWMDRDLSKKQNKEEFHSKIDRWTQKLAASSSIMEVRHL